MLLNAKSNMLMEVAAALDLRRSTLPQAAQLQQAAASAGPASNVACNADLDGDEVALISTCRAWRLCPLVSSGRAAGRSTSESRVHRSTTAAASAGGVALAMQQQPGVDD